MHGEKGVGEVGKLCTELASLRSIPLFLCACDVRSSSFVCLPSEPGTLHGRKGRDMGG